MIRTSSYVIAAACAFVAGSAPLHAQQDLGREGTSWHWDGPVASGGSLKVYNINGALHFTASPDGSAHVQAEKHVHSGGDPRTVHYAVVRDGNDLTICALWNDNATCDANGMHNNEGMDNNGDRRHNVTVEISVQVPAGVSAGANTINGDVSVERISSEVMARTVNGTVRVEQVTGQVSARTVNGDVTVDTRGGQVSAETVNGSVTASMGSGGTGDMRFRTVNGSIDITAPSSLNADVELRTSNGTVESKYPLHFDRRHTHADGTVGSGGRRLSASSVNGSVTLH